MDHPRGRAARSSPARQPSLAEEIEEVEREPRVTRALQAVDHQHGMGTKESPNGQEPQEQTEQGVSNTPRRTPKKGGTPSPVKIDDNGDAWELEDHEEAQEEQEENGDEGERARGTIDSRSRAGSIATEGPVGKPVTSKAMDAVIKNWLYPEGV